MGRPKARPILRASESAQLRSVLLDQFDPHIAAQLIEFGKFIASLDEDVLVFMARKSLCLYDILLAIGIPPSERTIISDRALDLNIEALKGKRVALIDDTLIVGTTIAKAKELLSAIQGTTVTVHVFCTDATWQVDSIVKPDTVFLRTDDRTVMNFCAALVRAMSLLPRPYLVDFPLTVPFRIRSGDLQCLLSSTSWQCHHLSSPLQMTHGAETYTVIPVPETFVQYFSSTNKELRKCVEIVKIRLFGRWHEDVLWLRAVPIVTLLPLADSTINALITALLDKLANLGPDSIHLRQSLTKPPAQQRFIQFLLGIALGKAFFADLQSSIGSKLQLTFDEDDTDRHYGPWLHNSLADCTEYAEELLRLDGFNENIRVAPVPHRARELATEVLEASSLPTIQPEHTPYKRNVVADCCTLFAQMYHIREIPARREAQRLGKRVMHASAKEAPYRDRLNIGLPWTAIVRFVRRLSSSGSLPSHPSMVSLALDVCNDLGIAVPITCSINNVTFRAYRYGEDAPFGDSELRLAYEAVNGYLLSAQRDSVSRLTLEKLLVFLLRGGVSTQLLKPFYGPSGTDGTVRVAFNLKGAIVLMSRGPRDRADRNVWLSQHLCERGTLATKSNGQYRLGKPPESDGNSKLSINQAKQLGMILGHCIKRLDGIHDSAPLDDRALIVIMTCCTPHHTAAALQVELDLFRSWYEATRPYLTGGIRWNSPKSLDYAFSALVRSSGYEAIHSGWMKYKSYSLGDVPTILKQCASFLGEVDKSGVLRDIWEAAWDSILTTEVRSHTIQLAPLINEAAYLIGNIGVCLTSLEIALAIGVDRNTINTKHASLKRSTDKLTLFSQGIKNAPASLDSLRALADLNIDELLARDNGELATEALMQLDVLVDKIGLLVERMEPVIEQYGRVRGLHKYKYVIYYDIVDSEATKAAQHGDNTEHRKRMVYSLKQSINTVLKQISITARKHRCEIFCTNGNAESDNDCKHIFTSGKMARQYTNECIQQLLFMTQSFPGIHLRIYTLPCNFVRSDAYRYNNDEEVRGPRFWANLSRVLRLGKKYEEEVGNETSFLLAGDLAYLKDFHLPEATWSSSDALIETELAEAFRKIPVRYGALRPIPSLLPLEFER